LVHDLYLLLARLLMAPIMMVYGAQKLLDISHFLNNPATKRMMEALASGASAPVWFAYANGAFQLLAGLFVLLGVKARISAGLVVIWLLPVTYFGHPFWAGIRPDFNEAQFYKNLAIIAAYLLIATVGAGRYSIDNVLAQRGRS
jgi:putative oxidoreductase